MHAVTGAWIRSFERMLGLCVDCPDMPRQCPRFMRIIMIHPARRHGCTAASAGQNMMMGARIQLIQACGVDVVIVVRFRRVDPGAGVDDPPDLATKRIVLRELCQVRHSLG